MKELSTRPLKLKSNRVWRTYSGGRMIDELHGYDHPGDSQFPEDWVASLITARNPGREHIKEGLSLLETQHPCQCTLKEAIDSDPIAFLGNAHVQRFGNQTGVLVKMLDSAERLTIQVHPDQQKAFKLFNSPFGKTEAWYVLGGRKIGEEPPYVLLGFKPGITRELWEELFKAQDIEGMIHALHKFYVQAGDVFLIEGGIPHAIGPGCFLIEVQEPTDYTIRTERKTPRGVEIPDALCHQGLGFQMMFECFRYEGFTREETLRKWKIAPVPVRKETSGKVCALIGHDNTDKFAMNLIEVHTELYLESKDSFSILLPVQGCGALRWGTEELPLRQGEQIFLPHNAPPVTCCNFGKEVFRLIRCFPPDCQ